MHATRRPRPALSSTPNAGTPFLNHLWQVKFLLEKGGRSSNTELLARYSSFLNDPQNKSAAREAFKGFVNALGLVNTEDGVKYIMLKKKFRHLLEDHGAPASQERATDLQDSRENVRLPIPALQTQEEKPGGSSSVSKREQVTEAMVGSPVSPVPHCTNIGNKCGLDPGSHQDLSKRDSSKASESSEVGAEPNTFEPSNGVTSVESINAVGNLTKSDIDRTSVTQSSDDDVSSNHSGPRLALDPTEHEWMIRAAEGNWEALRTMLLSDPGLALRRDPLTGLTALHWAAKHGSADIIPLLLAAAEKTGHRHENGGVNMRSAGGYTPLHLAAMHESLDVAKMLVGAYEANVKSRDYGGFRPWQYLQATARWDMKDLLGAPEIEDDEDMWLDNQRQPQSWRSRLSKAQLGGFRLHSQSAENEATYV
uniref:SOWAHA-C winged helix-turn-helix domain-containing protein n=1 Tax=Eptatretus burgeri TaxID=7764 RepID=A0A8C4ND21_EPTBU